jgi:hypothetical protein
MRKYRFGDGLLVIMASAVASHKLRFRFHGGRMGCGALGMPYLLQHVDFLFCRCKYGIPMPGFVYMMSKEYAAAVVVLTDQQLVLQMKIYLWLINCL